MMTVTTLKERVAKAVVEFSEDGDYCYDGQIDFLIAALNVTRAEAEILFDSATPKKSYKIVIEFEVPANSDEDHDFTQDEYNLQELIWCDNADAVSILSTQFVPI